MSSTLPYIKFAFLPNEDFLKKNILNKILINKIKKKNKVKSVEILNKVNKKNISLRKFIKGGTPKFKNT